jgi:hypothetical protein
MRIEKIGHRTEVNYTRDNTTTLDRSRKQIVRKNWKRVKGPDLSPETSKNGNVITHTESIG